MQLRRFTADSTPAALGAVRKALGDDAIILANRKIGDQVEIIATGQMEDGQSLAEISLDDSGAHDSLEHNIRSRSDGHSVEEGRKKDSTTFEELTAAIDAVAKKTEPLVFNSDYGSSRQIMDEQPVRHNGAHVRTSAASEIQNNPSVSGTRPEERVRDQPETIKATPLTETHKSRSVHDRSTLSYNEQLLEIFEAQSTLINNHFKALEVNLWGNNSPNRRLHLQRLFSMGIGAELAIRLVERAHPDATLDDALRQSFALLKSTLPIGVDKTFTVPGVTIFTGAPGAGKTTALMKVAMQHVKENGSDSIVIICADTRRIGAFEELQAYGRLLGVPIVHAHDSSELDSLLAAFTHKQLILIDHTLPLDRDAVEIPKRLLKPETQDSVRQLMVLSATAQSATTDALISRHCGSKSMQCVLTHLDSSARLGEMFNAIIRYHLPIAYWSDTASIQNPLQKAEASVLIATAVAMSRRLESTPDDEWLMRLIQPSDQLMSPPVYARSRHEVDV